MNQNKIETYWNLSYETLYDSYYQELMSEALTRRWKWIDIATTFLVAATASGSAIAGWSLWSTLDGRFVWVIFAGIASVASIAHGVMGVPTRVKEQEDLRHMFSELRIDLETFRQQLKLYPDVKQVESQYNELRKKYAQCKGRTSPDIAIIFGFRKKVQHNLDNILKERGDIK